MPSLKNVKQEGRIPLDAWEDEGGSVGLDPLGEAFDAADWGTDADGPEVADELDQDAGPGRA